MDAAKLTEAVDYKVDGLIWIARLARFELSLVGRVLVTDGLGFREVRHGTLDHEQPSYGYSINTLRRTKCGLA